MTAFGAMSVNRVNNVGLTTRRLLPVFLEQRTCWGSVGNGKIIDLRGRTGLLWPFRVRSREVSESAHKLGRPLRGRRRK
jgi:hypothetical protein